MIRIELPSCRQRLAKFFDKISKMSEEEKDPAEEQEETEVVPEVDPTSQMSAREYFEHRLNELFKLAEDEKQKRLKELMMW